MAKLVARDLLNVPGLISLSRVPLAIAFPFALGHGAWALVVLATSAATDVLDGWYARRHGLVTATGAVLDGVTDKIFAIAVLASLLVSGGMTPVEVVLLGTRELLELPLVLRIALSRRARARRIQRAANVAGKLTTVLQFAAVLVILLDAPHRAAWIYATALAGAAAAVLYAVRELSGTGSPAAPRPS